MSLGGISNSPKLTRFGLQGVGEAKPLPQALHERAHAGTKTGWEEGSSAARTVHEPSRTRSLNIDPYPPDCELWEPTATGHDAFSDQSPRPPRPVA
jgi:hypothetical protein